ncbi:cytidine deaminase [Rasiella rasia]|uniref:Cytidine deaminase n=1 Tax=Rasiella rasia TaxID=2744027 RepID=A0A6G6GP51_9FLAO|nr:cytidine deaminase [Rasiella rasia]QIE60328.1 cytidine deaminase [Rasiella rasia]
MAQKLTITAELTVFESINELPVSIQKLMHKAQEARERAYAPYSRFMVGAALALNNETIVTGNNQENAAFPSGLCAERVAAFHAGSQFPGVGFKTMALTVRSLQKEVTTPTPPCGACRQALAEYEVNQKAPITIYFMGETGKVVKANSLKDLLPLVFDSTYL